MGAKIEPKTEATAEECFESLNGYEEIAITKAFGQEIGKLAEAHPTTFARALVFIEHKRSGMTDAEAKEAVMIATLAEVNGYFTEEPEDLDPEEPDSDAGKEEPPAGGSHSI